MDVLDRIDFFMQERNWTDYRLAQESGLASSTIANLRRRHTVPSIATLESICKAFGITLSQFFAEGESSVNLSDEQKQMFRNWASLTKEQKYLVSALITELKQK